MNKFIKYIIYATFIILLFILWEYVAGNNSTVRLMVSSPSLIVNFFQENYVDLLKAIGITFYESIMGLLIATSFSFFVIVLCFYIPKMIDYVLPIMVSSQVIPLITLAPLFIIIFGIGFLSKILMSALICFFPIFVNFANGVNLIPKNIHEMLFVYNASKTQKIFRVYFPLSTPYIITGLKIAATLSVIGAIVAEFSGAEFGLGRNLYISALRLEPEMMMSSLFLSAALGGTLYGIIVFIERLIGKWYLTK